MGEIFEVSSKFIKIRSNINFFRLPSIMNSLAFVVLVKNHRWHLIKWLRLIKGHKLAYSLGLEFPNFYESLN